MLKLGVASAFMYPDINRAVFGKKSLCFIEKDMANYISRDGVQPILIPDLVKKTERAAFLELEQTHTSLTNYFVYNDVNVILYLSVKLDIISF